MEKRREAFSAAFVASTAAIDKITYTLLGRWPLRLITPAYWKSEQQRGVLQQRAQLRDAHSALAFN